MFQWQHALSRNNPNKALAAVQLLNEAGISLEDLVHAANGGQPAPLHQQPQYADATANYANMQQANATLAQFSQGKPHFQAVRHRMGELILQRPSYFIRSDGQVDLDAAYQAAVREAGLGDGNNRARRNAASVSARGRAPSGHIESERQSGGSVRQSINNAIREARG